MRGKDVEIAIQRSHVHRKARHGLAPVDQNLRADHMGDVGGAAAIQHAAQHVGHMGQRDHAMARRDHRAHRVQIDPAIVGERHDVDMSADLLRHDLPRHDIAMMFQRGQQDAVARLQLRARPALGDEVDALGRAANINDLAVRLRADEAGDLPPRRFIGQRHIGRPFIDTAMHRRIIGTIGPRNRIDDGIGLLRGGGAVKIMPVAHTGEIIPQAQTLCEVGHTSASSLAIAATSSACLTASSATSSNTPATKERSSNVLAVAGSMPRLAM